MPIPATQKFEVPASEHAATKVRALAVSQAGTVAVSGANNAGLGNFQVIGASGGAYSAKCTPADAAPILVNFTLSKGANGSISAKGTYDAAPFAFELSSGGQLQSGGFPKLPAPQQSFFGGIGVFKLDKLLPIRPGPTHPETEDKLVATGKGGPGPVVSTPDFNGRCAGAVVLFIIAAAASEGISAVAGAAWLVGECHNWSFKA